MKVETLASVVFTEAELKESLLATLGAERNDLLHTDPKHKRLTNLIEHARRNAVVLDWVDGGFCMSIDGVCDTEEL